MGDAWDLLRELGRPCLDPRDGARAVTTPSSIRTRDPRWRATSTNDPRVVVDDLFDRGLPAGWTNAELTSTYSISGSAIKATNTGALVTRVYGTAPTYQRCAPYRVTWQQKTSGEWSQQTELARSCYYLPDQLSGVTKSWDPASADLYLDCVQVRQATNAEWAATSDVLRDSL